MKALILNSGMGKRMGLLTNQKPKCMTEIGNGETIISRQLKQLKQCGITEVIITTGFLEKVLVDYCKSLNLNLEYTFVNNPIYDKSNYIYSIYLARYYIEGDILSIHGDLVFELGILEEIIKSEISCMTVSSTISLPTKDFKAVIKDGRIEKIGVEYFDDAVAAQPLYKMNKIEWILWLKQIVSFCENGLISCYAENAYNEISHKCPIFPLDVKNRLCAEIDTLDDLKFVNERIKQQGAAVAY